MTRRHKHSVAAMTFLLCLTCISMFLREQDLQMTSYNFIQQQDTNPCPCGECSSENDTWFMERFNRSVQPFLSANYNLSMDDFSWWKLLQKESRNFSSYVETVDRLFEVFPPTPDLTQPSPHHCRTCAVVGNSVNLNRSNYGPFIDAHDVIIRMNYGPTAGFEADVGNRTTHRVMYPESAMDLDSSTHLVLFPFKIVDLEWIVKAMTTGFSGNTYAPVKPNITANKDLVMVLNPAFMRYVHASWLENNGTYPSTGFMSLVLSLHICDEVHVFGYGADKDGNWSHYWEKLKDKMFKTGIHPGTYEYEIIQRLAKLQKLTFFSGW